jgi:hypothetical protein
LLVTCEWNCLATRKYRKWTMYANFLYFIFWKLLSKLHIGPIEIIDIYYFLMTFPCGTWLQLPECFARICYLFLIKFSPDILVVVTLGLEVFWCQASFRRRACQCYIALFGRGKCNIFSGKISIELAHRLSILETMYLETIDDNRQTVYILSSF